MVVGHTTPRDKQGRYTRGLDINVTQAEREAVAEWAWRVESTAR